MSKVAFRQTDIRRAVKAALDGGYPVGAVEIELPNGTKLRLLPEEKKESDNGKRKPDPW